MLFALAVVLLVAILSYRGWMAFDREADQMLVTQHISSAINAFLSGLNEAETGQRGFLLTGEDRYLEMYSNGSASLPALLKSLELATRTRPDQARRVENLKSIVNQKLEELALTVRLRRAGRIKDALAVVRTNRGIVLMLQARSVCITMRNVSSRRLADSASQSRSIADQDDLVAICGCAILFSLLLVANITIQHGVERRQALIVALRQSERQLEETAADAQAANRAKSIFLSTMSHEIRTPLNAVLGYAQLMLRDPALGPEAQAHLQIIGRSGEHLLTLINAVLDMSKIESGQSSLDPVTFSLTRLLEDLAAMFRLRTAAKALGFEMLLDGVSVPYLVADEGKIRQMLINLLGNAIKFTRSGHIKLHLNLRQQTAESLWLCASVEDTGPGIPEEYRQHLFEPFTQANGGPNINEGTGLGLAISRQFARLMGGDLRIVSSSSQGSVIEFDIPVLPGNAGVTLQRTDRRRVIGLRAGTRVPKVLIADDQLENRDWLMKLLRAIGFSVQVADNGETAIQHWEDWEPQIILMDVHMPVLDGLAATRRIKADPRGRHTAIIMLTASVLEQDRRAVFASGADAFLTKPCREEELLDKMGTLLKIDYDYEESDGAEELAETGLGKLGPLPLSLVEALRNATSEGNKKLLDQLILQVRDSEAAASANALQSLANRYDYDGLTNLLKDASCQAYPQNPPAVFESGRR